MKYPAGAIVFLLATAAASAVSAQIDLSGEWSARYHEDQEHRIPGPELGDYTGLPINDAGRLKADSWDASILSLREHQAKPHPSTYSLRGPANIRITKQFDPVTQETIAYELFGTFGQATRVLWLDGRPHPPAYAPHTWAGFSTGSLGRRRAHRRDDAFQGRLAAAQRRRAQRPGDDDGAFLPARGRADGRDDRPRPGVPRGAVHPQLQLGAEPDPDRHAQPVRRRGRGGGAPEGIRPALPARFERRAGEADGVRGEAQASAGGHPRRRGGDVPGVSAGTRVRPRVFSRGCRRRPIRAARTRSASSRSRATST